MESALDPETDQSILDSSIQLARDHLSRLESSYEGGVTDDAIAKLQVAIASDSEKRNLLSPIFQLPAEIFTNILMIVFMESGYTDSHGLLKIISVSRMWRTHAIEDSRLWTRFTLTKVLEPHPNVVSWSKAAPISISFSRNPNYIPSSSTWDFISSNAHRIRELNIDDECTAAGEIISDWPDAPVPCLEAMHISYYENAPEELIHTLSKLLDGNAPNLKDLSIVGLDVDWNWSTFSQLTELFVGEHHPPISLEVLRTMPMLNYLEFYAPDCPPEYDNHTHISLSEVVEFAQMRKLGLAFSSFKNFSFFLNHIRVPSTAEKKLHLTPVESDMLRDYLPFQEKAKHLRAVWTPSEMFRLHVDNTELEVALGTADVGPGFLFALALECIVNPRELEDLKLELGQDPRFFESDWMNSLMLMSNVLRVEVNLDASGCALLRVLCQRQSGPMPVLMPRLQTLCIRALDSEFAPAWANLEALVCARDVFGARLINIELETHGTEFICPSESQIEEVKNCVDRFEWIEL